MSYLIRRVLAKLRLILDEMCRLYGKFACYLRRVLCKTRLIFPRVNGPTVLTIVPTSKFIPPPWCTCRRQGGRMLEESFSWLFMLQKKCYLRVFSVNKIVISICICGFKVCVVISDSWVGTTVSGVYEHESTVLAYGKIQNVDYGLDGTE